MFNFNELAIVQPNEPNCYRGSFVGIRQDKYLGKMAFTVPKGFEDFEVNYDNVKNLFFSMYRTFDKFLKKEKKNENLDNKPTEKDNIQIDNHRGAYRFTDEDNNQTILYSKIDLIDSIFQLYKEMEIESLIQELGLVEDIDYSKIDRYLDKGIYLDNHAIFIENMVGYRNIVRGVPSELIEIFCYIYHELANELKQEVSESIKEISFNFSYQFLSPEQSLFSEYSFESTMNTLKDCLDNIHKMTAYKNGQYWDIYEAVEHFLYGSLEFDKDSSQGFWGINNFSYIWEEMCNYMVAVSNEYKILYCDTKLPLNQYKDHLLKQNRIWIDKNEIENVFHIDLHGYKRWLRPDIITRPVIANDYNENPLDSVIKGEKKILSIKSHEVKSRLSFGTNNINIDFSLNVNREVNANQNSDIIKKGEEIFNRFSNYFSNLYRIKGVAHGSLKGYQYIPKGKYSFSVKNISKDKYDEIYQKIFNSYENNNIENENRTYITDWKYYFESDFEKIDYRNNDRINISIIKSLAYEFCLQQALDIPINSQFAIPFYDFNCNDIVIDLKMLDCTIELVKMNFLKIQEIYLND